MRQGRDRGLAEHEELVACCRRRDAGAAVALLERHIKETARGLIAALKKV
jgi:DNA-binding GntR family transcriptional regulator